MSQLLFNILKDCVSYEGKLRPLKEELSKNSDQFKNLLEDIEDYIGMKIPVSSVEESLMPDLKVPEKPEHRSLKKKDGFSKKNHSRSKKKL